MSRIEELIKEKCPNGVEYKTLGEVCSFQNGFAFKSNIFKSSGESILRITNIQNGIICSDDIKYFSLNDYKGNLEQYKIYPGDIVIAMSGATTGKVGKNTTNIVFYLNQRVGKLIPNINILLKDFLYHFLLSKSDYMYNLAGGGAQPNLSTGEIKKVKIPVPPMEVQKEIVRILDKFAELEAELETELEARKSQYEFWREKLFDFKDDVNLLKIQDVCLSIKDGMHNLPESKLCSNTYPILSAQNIINGKINYNTARYADLDVYNKEKNRLNLEIGDVLLTIVATIGRTAVVDNNEILFQRSVCILKPNKSILSKYLKYYLDTKHMQNYMKNNSMGSAQAGLYLGQVSKIIIPVPSIEEQERIVNILDKFDKLINDINEGIPAEIEFRRKQYEYYRNKLLSFKEL